MASKRSKPKERLPLFQPMSAAPPLDYSFKRLRQISDILTVEPRQGNRKPINKDPK